MTLDRRDIGALVVVGVVGAATVAAGVAFFAVLVGLFVRVFRAVAG